MKKEKYTPKARRVQNRIKKIMITNKAQHCYLLDICFNKKTFNNTTEQTRHKYIIQALNLLNGEYIAVMNYNKDHTKEHYRAIISTYYKEFLNHLTFKWLKTKGTMRHKYITSKEKDRFNARKVFARISETHKNKLNDINNKIVIYSDNKLNIMNELHNEIQKLDNIKWFKQKSLNNNQIGIIDTKKQILATALFNVKNMELQKIQNLFTAEQINKEIEKDIKNNALNILKNINTNNFVKNYIETKQQTPMKKDIKINDATIRPLTEQEYKELADAYDTYYSKDKNGKITKHHI